MGEKRRIDVMLSSTFIDLEEHRASVLEAMNGHLLQPLAQEFDAAMPGSDLIKASLDKVESADAYVCIIGSRYGQRPTCEDRNPLNLSLTELEYRRAVDRGIPRCVFIMGAEHSLTRADLDRSKAEGAESHALLDKFIALARKDRITAEFTSPDNLKAQAATTFIELRKIIDAKSAAGDTSSAAKPSAGPDDIVPTAAPAFHFVRKPYVEKQGFAGRIDELALIDGWATGADALLLFQAIGGMGKSMLTWHWLKNYAPKVRTDWAGQLWYSFYEQGADLNDFLVHALAYIRHVPPSSLRTRRTLDLGHDLRQELDARPWMLIMDGLERVLVAYNRAGKEHMSDEDAEVVRDGMGLDRAPRACFRPEDDDVLAILAQATRGKLLASSRLTPTALLNEAQQPIPGVKHFPLEGLAPEDAEQVLRTAGVKGDGWRMRRYLEENFACHPLSVGAVAGQIMTFQEARGDFDRWVESPKGGKDPGLITGKLRGRQNHILSRAFEALDADHKALLGSLAMANIELTPELIRLLNPMRPIEPEKIGEPNLLSDADRHESYDHHSLMRERDRARTDEGRATAQAKLNEFREKRFAEQRRRFEAYLSAYQVWQQQVTVVDAWVERALPELEARGLLQYDAVTGTLDMHPAIRHTALLGLSPEARTTTGSHVSDALSSRPNKPFDEARTRDDLALVMTRVEALNAARKLGEGWALLTNSGLSGALFRLRYAYEELELLQPYFPHGWEQGPVLLPEDKHIEALSRTAATLYVASRPQSASVLFTSSIRMRLAQGEDGVAGELGRLAACLRAQGQRARADRLRSMGVRLGDACKENVLFIKLNQAKNQTSRGQLVEAKTLLADLREQISRDRVDAFDKALILECEVELAFRAECLNAQVAEDSLHEARLLRERAAELAILETIGHWHQSNSRHDDALDTYGHLIALSNEIGSQRLLTYEARRALSLGPLGRANDARRITARINQSKNPPHVPLALLYLALSDHPKARAHALDGFKEAWGEGPPYHDHWDLEDCRKVLAAVGEPEPKLPPFDPAKIEPFDFEPAVERLIEKELAEKGKLEAEEAKREAERNAKAAPVQAPEPAVIAEVANVKSQAKTDETKSADSASVIAREWVVAPGDVDGAQFIETHRGTHIFALKDGRFYIDGTIAVATLAHARSTIDELAKPKH